MFPLKQALALQRASASLEPEIGERNLAGRAPTRELTGVSSNRRSTWRANRAPLRAVLAGWVCESAWCWRSMTQSWIAWPGRA
jgi:hypothetical protein